MASLPRMIVYRSKVFLNIIGYDVFRISFPFSRLICTQVNSDVVKNFISIFTMRSFDPGSLELKHLRLNLSTEVVETALKGFKSWKRALAFFNWASTQPGYSHNCYTFNAMALILSGARQNASLSALASDMLNSNCYLTPGALGQFLKYLGRRGLTKEANKLFDEVKRKDLCSLNSYVYSCLLGAISKSNDVDLLEMRLNEMLCFNWEMDKYSLTPVLQCYCNVGKFEQALALFNEMFNKGMVDDYVLSMLVVSISKMGEVGRAFELVERMEDFNISLNEKTFYVLIHGFARKGQLHFALQLYNKMQKQGFIPDISIFDTLIGGLCTKGEVLKALNLFSQMKSLGLKPDIKIICQLLPFVSEREMNLLIKEIPPNLDNESTLLLYNAVLKCLTTNGSVEKAFHLIRAMMGDEDSYDIVKDLLLSQEILVQPSTTSFEIVTEGLCRTHKLNVALELFHDENCTCGRSVLLYNCIIDALSSADRLDECYKLVNEMKESGLRPTNFTQNSIFRCLCTRMDAPEAMLFVKYMHANKYEPWIKNYTLLVEKLCDQGRPAEARDFLDQMTQVGFLPNIVAYSAAIDGFVKMKELDHALHLFRDLCQRGGYCPDVVAYNTVIHGLCKAERLSEAHDLLDEMSVKGLVPSVVTHNLLVDAWCKIGNVDRAYSWLLTMAEGGGEPSVVTYTTLIDGFCNSNRSKDAVKLFHEMEEKGCSPNRVTFMAFIYGLCKCNMAYEAQLYLSMMEEREMVPDAYIYVALIDAFISKAGLNEAFVILEKMANLDVFPDSTDKNHLSLRKAISIIRGDPKVSSSVENLIKAGRLPPHVIDSEIG